MQDVTEWTHLRLSVDPRSDDTDPRWMEKPVGSLAGV